jgi:hypothetical protein
MEERRHLLACELGKRWSERPLSGKRRLEEGGGRVGRVEEVPEVDLTRVGGVLQLGPSSARRA